jgi:Mg-chelatase subunit ChlD
MSYKTIGGTLAGLLLLVGAAACGDDGDDDVNAQITTVDSDRLAEEPEATDDTEPADDPQAGADAEEVDDSSLLLIMDSSGSMNSRGPDGEKLIDSAKGALNDLVAGLPDEKEVGLRVYGHTVPNDDEENGCKDTELIHPVGPLDREGLTGAIESYDAKGFTPIGLSLEEAANDLPAEGERTIVLVSDGIDTCSPPDPCDVAEGLASDGIETVIHTVGFALDQAEEGPEAREQLSCIAEVSGGEFVDVETADELAETLEDVSTRDPRDYETAGTELQGSPIPRDAETGTIGTSHTDVILGGEVNFYRFEVEPGTEVQADMIVTPSANTDDGSLFCPVIYLTDQADSELASPNEFGGGGMNETFIKATEVAVMESDEVWIKVESGGCTGGAVPADAEFNLELHLAEL